MQHTVDLGLNNYAAGLRHWNILLDGSSNPFVHMAAPGPQCYKLTAIGNGTLYGSLPSLPIQLCEDTWWTEVRRQDAPET